MLRDFLYVVRGLRRYPIFTATAVLTLSLAIVGTTVMFTVVDGVLLKPLPYPEADRLVSLHERTEQHGTEWSLAYLNFLDIRRQSRTLAPMAAWLDGGGMVSSPGDAEYVSSVRVSGDLFSLLGVRLEQGRTFLPEEEHPGATPVAIVTDRLWRRRYGGSPRALGQQLVFDGRAYTVIGIVSADLQLPGDAEVITPLGQDVDPAILNRGMHPGIYVLGRRRSGVTLEQSQTELSTISRRLSEMYPKSNANHDFVAEPLQEELVEDLRPALLLLQGAVGLVLLTASANVASLLLTRALSHQREYAVRVALGASPWRLVRQSLTEGGVLGICGGAIGTVLAVVGTRPFVTVWPGGLARADDVYLDWRALLFTLAVSLLSGLLVGVAPALCAAVREPESVLRAGTANGALNRRFLRRSFVVFEISLAVTLLIATGRVGRTVLRFSSAGPGLKARGVLVTQVALAPSALAAPASIRAAWRGVLQHVRTMPGVQSAAVVDIVPMTGENEIGYWLGPTQPRENEMPLAVMTLAAPDYLQVMGIRLREGRFFNENDRIGSEPVIAIDETMAQRAFRGREPVGNRISLEFLGSARVVGVVGHVRSQGLGVDDTASPHPQVYFPFAQVPDVFVPVAGARLALVVRTTVPPLGIVESIRNELRKETRDEVLYDFRTMEQIVSATLSRQRFFLLLFAVFSGLALVLTCVGTYGALAHLTSQRAQELATRIALGAQRGDIVRLVLGESLGMILVGICLGMAVSLASAPLLNHLMVGLQPLDLLTTLSIIAVLVTTASFASFLPARRAGRIDPMKTIRQE